jgi:hypothetical protein
MAEKVGSEKQKKKKRKSVKSRLMSIRFLLRNKVFFFFSSFTTQRKSFRQLQTRKAIAPKDESSMVTKHRLEETPSVRLCFRERERERVSE